VGAGSAMGMGSGSGSAMGAGSSMGAGSGAGSAMGAGSGSGSGMGSAVGMGSVTGSVMAMEGHMRWQGAEAGLVLWDVLLELGFEAGPEATNGSGIGDGFGSLCWGHVHVIEGAAWRER